MAHRPEDVRNVALVGSGGAGKTTLVESLLHLAKQTTRKGSVPEKNTVTDFDADEKDRGQSIFSSVVHLPWEGKRVQIVDCPGAADFVGDALTSLAAVETAVIVVSASQGVGVGTRRMFKAARDLGLACVVLVTRVEQENVDGDILLDSLQQAFGERAVPINLPDHFGPKVSAMYDVFGPEVPAHLTEAAARSRQQVTDRVVEVDDALLERYLADGKVTLEDLEKAFPKALRQGNVVPILHVSAEKEVGLRKLLTFLVHDCPRPVPAVVRRATDPEGNAVAVDAGDPFSAQVWKIQVDAHVGKLAFLRVWSGQIASKTQFVITRGNKVERIGDLLEVQGKDVKPVPSAAAGDIVAVAKAEDVKIGDTVTDGHATHVFEPIKTPVPKVTLAVEPKNRADDAKLIPELTKLAEGDPTFVAEREESTHQFVVRGMSALHLDLTLRRLARRKVEVVTHPPRIPYRETVLGKSEAMYRHKKQSGGRGQFAEVHLRVAPLVRGSEFEFVDDVVGGTIPRQFIPAVEKGIRDTLPKGVIAGYPFTDVRATVFFGKYHDVDSDEFSFKLAASQAFKAAVEQARPALLEPVMEVSIEVPSRFMGDISGDLNSRRGRIVGMETEQDHSVIKAMVPLSEMLNYSTELRSITAGEGDYSYRLDHYDVVPGHLASELVAKHKRELEAAHT
jgi:elongation factor G